MANASASTLLLTRPEAAARLATCIRKLDLLIASGDIAVVRIGKSVRIRPSALDYFIESRESRVNNTHRTQRARA